MITLHQLLGHASRLAALFALAACDRTGGPIVSRDTAATRTTGALTITPVVFGTNDFYLYPSTTDAEEGYLTVPERHDGTSTRTLRIHFIRFRATGKHPGPPTIYLAGGPGGSGSFSAAGDRYKLFMRLREAGDVIALDQRGVRFADPNPVCPGDWSYPLDQPLNEATLRATFTPFLQRCATAIGRQLRLDAFTTVESAHDIDWLRQALQAERVNLWGISHGAHLGLMYLRLHPDRVNRAVFAGVEGPDDTWKHPGRIDRVLRSVDSAVAADPAAHAAVPDLVGSLQAALTALSAHPRVRVAAGSGSPVEVVLGPDDLRLATFFLLSERPSLEGRLLRRLAPVFLGDYRDLARFALRYRLQRQELVMALSMECSAGASPGRRRVIAEEADGTILQDIANLWLRVQCADGAWPVAALSEDLRSPVASGHPVLFISGSLDPRTPPENVSAIASGFPRGRHLVVDGALHDDDLLLSSPRIGDEILRFLLGADSGPSRIRLNPLRFEVP